MADLPTQRGVQCSNCQRILAVTGEPWTPPPLYSWHVLEWGNMDNEALQTYCDKEEEDRQGISLLHAVNRCPGLWHDYPENTFKLS